MSDDNEPPPAELNSPVRGDEERPFDGKFEHGVALCLSGGGYRAMLFHTGSLIRLNELGYLPELARISSVSGGSITAAALGLSWARLSFDDRRTATNFHELVVEPIQRLADQTIDKSSVLLGMFGPRSIAEQIMRSYERHLLGAATLQDLPDRPRFVLNATNLQSGVLWRFMKPYMRDYLVGEVKNPRVKLALAVAASSANPPFLSPLHLKLSMDDYSPEAGEPLHRREYMTDVVLSDGGVYDNFGLETAWKRYDTVLVSDAGGQLSPESDVKSDWLRQLPRVVNVIDSQVRSLRKRQVVASFISGERKGAYWGIRSEIAKFDLPDTLDCPPANTQLLAGAATRLARLGRPTQHRLINWGYAICDAAMRKHVLSGPLTAPKFPFPGAGVG
jgi:NTE family protein